MNIRLYVDRSYATLAIQHALAMGEAVKSRKKFIKAVEDYMEGYGKLCVDDHGNEYAQYEEEADDIVYKYYKD